MIRTGLILALASACGFLANFIFSTILDKLAYGELVTIFALVSIFSLVAPLGTNAYFLTNPIHYKKHSNAVIVVPSLISATFGIALFFTNASYHYLSFITLLVVSTISVQGVMACQINQNGPRAAIFQSIQPLLKTLGALVTIIVFSANMSNKEINNALFITLLIASLVSIPILLNSLVQFKSGDPILSLRFLIELDKTERKRLFSFWISSNLGTAYSLGIIPLVAYFHGKDYAAYLGIYFIYWSGANILTTIIINHHYWPRYCTNRVKNIYSRPLLLQSLFSSIATSFFLYLTLTFATVFVSEYIWSDYPNLRNFLLIAALAVSLRTLSAWLSMMMLSFGDLIIKKTKVQLLLLLTMLVVIPLLSKPSYETIAWTILLLEIGYLIGYCVVSAKPFCHNILNMK